VNTTLKKSVSLKIAVLGIGKMGMPIAQHLTHAGYPVVVCDPDPLRCQAARELGLQVAATIAQAIDGAWLAISSLPADAALTQVAGEIAAARSLNPAALIYADTSTVSLAASAHAAQVCERAGVVAIRATISGNNHMLADKAVTVMVSGSRDAYDRIEPVFASFSSQRFYLGEAEQARLMKLVINLMIVQTSAMLAEALSLGRAGGLDWQAMWQVIAASAVASPIVKAKGQQLSQRDFTPTFTVEQMIKDVDLMLAAGADHHVLLAQTALTRQALEDAKTQGFGGEDYAAIIKILEHRSGLK
jgi:3-hydroxyisobutyrate dehydrogenase-like beta-hydroxyacid dehydrogenase